MYSQQAQQPGAQPPPQGDASQQSAGDNASGSNKDDVIDADFTMDDK
jgi:hypothetical protein